MNEFSFKMTIARVSSNLLSICYITKETKNKPSPQSQYFGISGRSYSSVGLWLVALIPLACCPGFYSAYSHCKSSSILSIYAIQVGLSTLYILFDLYCQQSKNVENLRFLKFVLIKYMTNRFVPVLISFSILIFYNNCDNAIIYFCAAVLCLLQDKFCKWVFNNFSDSFSVGEGLLISQAASLVLALSMKDLMSSSHSSENKKLYSFVQMAILLASLFAFILWRGRRKIGAIRFLLLLFVMSSAGIFVSSFMLEEWTHEWLIHLFFSPTRIALVGWWLNVFVLMMITTFMAQRYPYIPQTVLRKTFHILMVLIMVPGILLDPSLTYLAATGSTIFFLLLEIVRISKINPFSSFLNSLFSTFLDEKDQGTLVLSHIYLLVGLALPLWIYPCDFLYNEPSPQVLSSNINKVQFCILPLLAGVLSVGVGDSAASIGGTYFGKHKFPGTQKSVEGTICNIASQILFVLCIVQMGPVKMMWNAWPKLVLAISLNALVEAFTDQVDNIVLPLLLYTPLMDS